MKFGASDSVVACLLQHFPESIFTRDVKGRLPTQLVTTPRNQIMESIINVMHKSLSKKHQDALEKSTAEMRDDLHLQNKLNSELEREKTELETNHRKAQAEINVLQSTIEELQRLLHKQQKQNHQLQQLQEQQQKLQQQQQQHHHQLSISTRQQPEDYSRRSSRSKSRTRRIKTETRDSGDSTISVGGGISIHGDSRYRPLGHVESVVHRMERRKTKQDPQATIMASSSGGESKIFRTANFFRGFSTSSVKE
jgi:TolA-binding protein